MDNSFDHQDPGRLWEQVWDYIGTKLSPLSASAQEHLLSLADTVKGRHFLACLSIDLEAQAVLPCQITQLLEMVPADERGICDRIADVLSTTGHDSLNCCSMLPSPPPEMEDSYVTVMELASFISKFVTPNTGEGYGPEEVAKVIDTYFQNDCDLSSLTRCDLGRSKRLWVLPKSEFEQLLSRANSGETAKVFLDALGLNFKRGLGNQGLPYLVAVLHPNGHDCRAKQPTSFDPWWGDSHIQFISFGKNDGWGRTQSCTGTRYIQHDTVGMPRERVHRDSGGLTGFKGQDIGNAPRVDNLSQLEILNAALERFVRLRHASNCEELS